MTQDTPKPKGKWLAKAIQIGTNDRVTTTGDTQKECWNNFQGTAAGVKYGSIVYYYIGDTDD